jgi:YgiT-type zinc finger domain-containing protein
VNFDLMSCPICSEAIEESGLATQVFRCNGVVVTVTGIPAVVVCPNCGNAVLEWEVAQQVEDLIQPMFQWAETHSLPKPIVTITFPEMAAVAA